MCQAKPNTSENTTSGTNASSNPNNNERMYPNLAELFQSVFAAGNDNRGQQQGQGEADGDQRDRCRENADLLRDIFNNMMYGNRAASRDYDSRPSAPPQPDAAAGQGQGDNSGSGCGGGGWRWHPPSHGGGGRSSHDCPGGWHFRPDRAAAAFGALLASFGLNVLSVALPLLLVAMMPHYLVVLGVLATMNMALGWPWRDFLLVVGAIEFLPMLDPILLKVFALYALYRTFVQRRPILDPNRWGRRSRISE